MSGPAGPNTVAGWTACAAAALKAPLTTTGGLLDCFVVWAVGAADVAAAVADAALVAADATVPAAEDAALEAAVVPAVLALAATDGVADTTGRTLLVAVADVVADALVEAAALTVEAGAMSTSTYVRCSLTGAGARTVRW